MGRQPTWPTQPPGPTQPAKRSLLTKPQELTKPSGPIWTAWVRSRWQLPSRSIKVRLGVAIVAGISAGVAIASIGRGIGWGWLGSAILAMGVALLLVQLLAHGVTSPLRRMTDVADAMATGDHTQRVGDLRRADEVGQLARSFDWMASQLEEVDRFRRDLVANAAHELRTPVATVHAILENVVDGVQAADAATLGAALSQVERLGRLVDQLLDLSRLESGTVAFDPTAVPVSFALEHVAESVRLRGGGVRVEVVVDGHPLALGDEVRIVQVLTNLVDNAIRHSPIDAQVVVTAREEGPDVVITVDDDGPGIPTEEASRVFDRFHRLDSARTRTDGGAGLGLSIARWIVDLHGGTILTEPRQPNGCRMVVTLPRYRTVSAGKGDPAELNKGT